MPPADGALLLGLDVGTSRIKVLLLDGEGAEVGTGDAPTPFEAREDGVETSAGELLACVARAVASLGPAVRRVAAVGIAGMAESGVPLDERDSPAGPIIAWHDPRGAETVERLTRRFGRRLEIRIGKRFRTVSSVAKLGWMVDHGARAVSRWLGVPELCLWRLTGAWATEHSLASRIGCYDLVERRYLREVTEAAGFPSSVFAPVSPAGAPLGRVTPGGAAWSGVPEGAPVALAGHDHLAGALGAGARVGDLANSVGTAETVLRAMNHLPDLERALELSAAVSIAPGGREWTVLAGAARAGLVVNAGAAALGRSPAELDALAAPAGSVDAARLLASLESGGPPDVPPGPPGAVWNGLLEALSRRTFDAALRLARLAGAPRRVLVFGGGSRSGPWIRAKARLAPAPLYRASTAEAAARGAAMLAGVAAGWWASADDAPAPPLEAATAQRLPVDGRAQAGCEEGWV